MSFLPFNNIKINKKRHSSPKHFTTRNTNSPRVQEYRPNINDLKQFFDDSKRSTSHSQKKTSSYNDAKPSYLNQDEIIFDGKNKSEFERVKQKFDRSHSSSSKPANLSSSSKNKLQSRSFEARNDINQKHHRYNDDYGMRTNNMNINESHNQQYDECEASSSKKKSAFQSHIQSSQEKQDNTVDLTSSFNLDGFKVSEDDDDDDDVSCRKNLLILLLSLHASLKFFF